MQPHISTSVPSKEYSYIQERALLDIEVPSGEKDKLIRDSSTQKKDITVQLEKSTDEQEFN